MLAKKVIQVFQHLFNLVYCQKILESHKLVMKPKIKIYSVCSPPYKIAYITFFKDDCGKNCVEENNKTKDGDTTDGDPACCEASTSRDDDSTEFLFNVKRKVEFCLVITYSIMLIWFIQCLILCISVHEFSEFKISSRTSTA